MYHSFQTREQVKCSSNTNNRKSFTTILQAKSELEKNDDSHFQQCCMILNNKGLKNYKYHLHPCNTKITRSLTSKTVDPKTISKRENGIPSLKSKLIRPARSFSSKLLAGLPFGKRPRTDNYPEDFATPCNLCERSPSTIFSITSNYCKYLLLLTA